jgi:hypothetical protein
MHFSQHPYLCQKAVVKCTASSASALRLPLEGLLGKDFAGQTLLTMEKRKKSVGTK